MLNIKLSIVLFTLLNLTNANIYDKKDEFIDPRKFGFHTFTNFFEVYWAACEKFKHRRYKKILKHRPEPGPFIYAGDHFVRGNNIIYDGWNAVQDFVTTWDADTFWKIFATWSGYGLIPFIGGYARA